MTIDQVTILMSELGPILNPPAVYASDEEKSWGIALEEDLTVLVQFDEQKASLVLACELGAPPEGDRLALYEILLQVNYHWETTGGNRMAINRPGGEVVQVFEVPAEGLDAIRLSEIVNSFAEAAKAWRLIVLNPASAQESMPDAPGAQWMQV